MAKTTGPPSVDRHPFAIAALLAPLALAPPLAAVDFIRGDANGDGAVSIADGHYILMNFPRNGGVPECFDSADANDTGKLDLADFQFILNFLILGGPPPPPPFPEPGADPTDDELSCDSSGGGGPVSDPAAALSILDTVVAGGEEGTATIPIAVSNGTSIAGISGRLRSPDGVITSVQTAVGILTGPTQGGFYSARLRGGAVLFGYITSFRGDVSLPPGENVPALELDVCLVHGTPPGEYPLVLDEGELIDWESGRAIRPQLSGGMLRVEAEVTANRSCNQPLGGPGPDCGAPPPVDVVFTLGNAEALPGTDVAVPFTIRADADVQGYSFSVDFDETLLRATGIEEVWEFDHQDAFAKYEFNNDDRHPGSGGTDEGFFVGAVIFSFVRQVWMPKRTDNEALRLRLRVKDDAPDGTTMVRFLDGGEASGTAVHNMVSACGRELLPEATGSFVLIDCHLEVLAVLPDITSFIRADSNVDGTVDISDAQATLHYLFIGDRRPRCFDAADANDDGTLEISDPIYTLSYLFLGGPEPPAPFPDPDFDPTADAMTCGTR